MPGASSWLSWLVPEAVVDIECLLGLVPDVVLVLISVVLSGLFYCRLEGAVKTVELIDGLAHSYGFSTQALMSDQQLTCSAWLLDHSRSVFRYLASSRTCSVSTSNSS